jgi:hypothetical protein
VAWMLRTGDRVSRLDALVRGYGQWPGCIGQGIGLVAWMHWTGDRGQGQ